MAKKKKGYGYKQGTFHPKNPEKYIGGKLPYFRSSFELVAFRKLDENPKILSWGSENVVIPYVDPGRGNSKHRYFMDLKFTITKDGIPQTYLVEIKPHSQTRPPKRGRKSEKTFINESRTWITNASKWKAAKKYCDQRGWKFLIWTEKDLRIT